MSPERNRTDPDAETVFYLMVADDRGVDMMVDFRFFEAIWHDPEDCDAERNFAIGTVVP